MTRTDSIKAVLFDLGNTLLDFDCKDEDIKKMFEIGARQAYDHLQDQGYRLPSFTNYHRCQLRQMLWRVTWARTIRRDFNALHTLRRISLSMGLDLTQDQLEDLSWRWYVPLSNTANAAAQARQVLDWLVQRKFKLGIISNTFIPGAVLDKHLAREGLLDYFPVRLYSCDTGFRKPSRKIFRLALRQLSCQPRQVVFVGDVPRTDVRGARRVGMIAVLKDYNQPRNLRDRWMPYTKPDFTITHMSQLKEIIEQLQGKPLS
ncbi:MAG: HAD family hydrolase [Phycisphaerae bacterium]|nr:HAD family hydrolase [Phycisphaerae bacterium]